MTEDKKRAFQQVAYIVETARNRAFQKINEELIMMYWQVGEFVNVASKNANYGDSVVDELAEFFQENYADLKDTFPNMSGFSVTNLKYMKRVYLFYNQQDINRHQLGDELENLIFSIPWRHQIEIITKSQNIDQAIFYMQKTIENNWSRSVLMNMIDANLYQTLSCQVLKILRKR